MSKNKIFGIKTISLISALLLALNLLFVKSINVNAAQIKTPTSVKVSAKVNGFTIKFKKSKSNITGYKIQYSRYKNFKNSKTVSIPKSTTKYTIKKIQSGKKYYVRVMAYKGNNLSKWTAKKSVVTKLSAKAMEKKTVGYWFVYSPQDTVADAYKIDNKGNVVAYDVTCNEATGKISYEKKIYRYMWCLHYTNKFIICSPAFADVSVTYVPTGDYGKYIKSVPVGPADSKKVTFKVYHYSKKPSVKTFLRDSKKVFI